MGYKLVIFDLDGTILNTLDDLADSLNYTLQENGMPMRTKEEVRSFVGNGIQKLIERAVLEDTNEAVRANVLKCFKEHYKLHCADKTRPYDGVKEQILKLRQSGCRTAVISNKADFAVQSLCQDYFPELFDYVVGEREGIRRKPWPDSVLEVLEKLGVKKEEALYVGDSEVDIQTAKNAGIDFVAVSWGFRDENYLKEQGAQKIVAVPSELFVK